MMQAESVNARYAIKVSDLRVFYGDFCAVKGVDLEVLRGERHALMGPNGSGKSTLAAALMGHPGYEVSGEIWLDGERIDELETHERREGMYGSIFWWVVKLGMAAALAGGGYLLNATGFDVDLEGSQSARTVFLLRLFDACIPMITSAIAIWARYDHACSAAHARALPRASRP